MPQILNRELTLTPDGENVKVNVRYHAQFTGFERHLVGLGLRFRERILVFGVDSSDPKTDDLLTVFTPIEFLEVTDGNVPQTIARNRTIGVARQVLDEDQNPFVHPDAIPDQIHCKIRIEAVGIPPAITEAFTDQEVLGLNIP